MQRNIWLLLFVLILPGCMYYYKVQTVKLVTPATIRKYDSINKYFILHQGDFAWHLSKPKANEQSLSGELLPLPWEHLKYKTTTPQHNNRYKKSRKPSEKAVLDELHIYINDSLISAFDSGDYVSIAYTEIRKVDLYTKAKGKTIASWVIPIAIIPTTILMIWGALGITSLIIYAD